MGANFLANNAPMPDNDDALIERISAELEADIELMRAKMKEKNGL